MFGAVAGTNEPLANCADARSDLRRCQPEIGRPHHFTLTHWDTARDLCEILAKTDADKQRLGLTEGPLAGHAYCVSGELTNRFNIGREPGKSMRGTLLAIEQTPDHVAFHHHPFAHLRHPAATQPITPPPRLLSD